MRVIEELPRESKTKVIDRRNPLKKTGKCKTDEELFYSVDVGKVASQSPKKSGGMQAYVDKALVDIEVLSQSPKKVGEMQENS